MTDSNPRGAELLERFAEFYEEVAKLKQAIEGSRLPIESAERKELNALTTHDQAALVSQRLQSLLQRQRQQVSASSTPAESDRYAIAQYAVAALADEVFINAKNWKGGEEWHTYLLEQKLFRSNTAGRDFFSRLDELVEKRATSRSDQDLAAVFLMCLRLGFRGRWCGTSGDDHLKAYKNKLIRFIGSADRAQQKGFQQAYQYKIEHDTGARMAPLSRWFQLGAIGAVLYLVISTVVWVAMINRFILVFGS